MATETENKKEQTVKEQVAQPSYFDAEVRPGQTTFTKGDVTFEVTPNQSDDGVTVGDVIVNDKNGNGVQVNKPAAPDGENAAPQNPGSFSPDLQTASAYGAEMTTAPDVVYGNTVDGGHAIIATDGTVTLVNKEAEELAAAKGAPPKTEAETGIQFTFGDYVKHGAVVSEVNLNGTEANIGMYSGNVDVFANRIKAKPVAASPATDAASTDKEAVAADAEKIASANAEEATSASAEEAAPTEAGKTEIRLSNTFQRAVVEGLNGTKIIIDGSIKDRDHIVYTTDSVTVKSAAEADAAVFAGPAVKVNGDITRLILAGNKVFDVNTTTGHVTAYGDVDLGDKLELAKPEPENRLDTQKIVISEDGKRVALNDAAIEKTADGVVAVATKGKANIKPPAESPSAIAAAEEKIGQVVEEGWKFLAEVDGKDLLVADKDSGIMNDKKTEKFIKKLRKENPEVALPDDAALKLMIKNAAKLGGFNTGKNDQPKKGFRAGWAKWFGSSSSEEYYRGKDSIANLKIGIITGKRENGENEKVSIRLIKEQEPQNPQPQEEQNEQPETELNDQPQAEQNDQSQAEQNEQPEVEQNEQPQVEQNEQPEVEQNEQPETEQNEQTQQSVFDITARRDGPTTLNKKGDRTFEITPESNVTVDETGSGIRVTRPTTRRKPSSSIIFDKNNPDKVTTNGATVIASDGVPAAVATDGAVTLVNHGVKASATAEGAKPETGLQLMSIENGSIEGKLDGTPFGIKDGNDITDSNIMVDTNSLQVTPAAEASTDKEKDIHYSLSEKFKSLVVQGANVNVRIEVTDGVTTIYTKDEITGRSADSANTGVGGAAIEVNENVARFTLAGGREFDINTATGKVTAYTAPGGNDVRNGGDPELADLAPVNADYNIVTSEDAKRVALNGGASLEKTADGAFVAATDVGRLASAIPSLRRQMLHTRQQRKPALGS